MAKITYPNKNIGDQFFATEANEIKTIVNGLDDAIATKSDATAVSAALAGKVSKYNQTLSGDANNIITPGFYDLGTAVANIPAAEFSNMLVMASVGGTYTVVTQEWTSHVSGVKYSRVFSVLSADGTGFTTLKGWRLTDGSDKADKDLSINTQTANYTLALSDRGNMVRMNVASANTLTVPPNSAVAFPVGTQIVLTQAGAGQTTIVAGTGVTINASGAKMKLTGQWSGATLIQVAANQWTLMGDLAA